MYVHLDILLNTQLSRIFYFDDTHLRY